MSSSVEIQHNVRDIYGARHWVTCRNVKENEMPLLDGKMEELRKMVANPNDLRVVRIMEEVIA